MLQNAVTIFLSYVLHMTHLTLAKSKSIFVRKLYCTNMSYFRAISVSAYLRCVPPYCPPPHPPVPLSCQLLPVSPCLQLPPGPRPGMLSCPHDPSSTPRHSHHRPQIPREKIRGKTRLIEQTNLAFLQNSSHL